MKTFFGEIKLFLSSPWRVVLFLLLPPLITVYFGVVFQNGVVEDTRIVIVDQDQTSLSRSLVQNFKDNEGFRVVQYEEHIEAGLNLIRQEQADVVLALPEGFSQDLKSGKKPSIYLGINGANMAISSNATKRASAIILTFNAGIEITRLQAKGYAPVEGMSMAQPVQIQVRQTGNPTGSFYDFLIWGLIGAIGHFPILLFSVTAFNTEEEGLRIPVFLNRFLVYVFFGVTELLLSILILVTLFPVDFKGDISALILLAALFSMAVTALGMLLSLVIRERTHALQIATVVALPALILSGHTWPMSGMPQLLQVLGHLEPLTYFANPLRTLALTGAADSSYVQDCQVLLLMIILFLGVSLMVIGGGKAVSRWKRAQITKSASLS